jgi:hypothetical protein
VRANEPGRVIVSFGGSPPIEREAGDGETIQVVAPDDRTEFAVVAFESGPTIAAAGFTVLREPSPPVAPWRATFVEPEPGLEPSGRADAIGVVETADPRSPLVLFWAGTAECYGLSNVAVSESESEVIVDIHIGRRVPPTTPCIAIAQRYSTAIELASPLGDRQIVNGDIQRPTVPRDYAVAVFEAWRAGDVAKLRQLSQNQAFDVLTQRAPRDTDEWAAEPRCEGAAGSTYCTWQGGDEALVLRVGNAAVNAGEPALVEARFDEQ